jgi:hypothetical protein
MSNGGLCILLIRCHKCGDHYYERLFLKLSLINVRQILNGYFPIDVYLFLVISIKWIKRTSREVVLHVSQPNLNP